MTSLVLARTAKQPVLQSQEKSSIHPAVLERLLGFRYHDPFEVLGRHRLGDTEVVRILACDTERVELDGARDMHRLDTTDIFEWWGPQGTLPDHYSVTCRYSNGAALEYVDPYSFAPQLDVADLSSFADGTHTRAHLCLGADPRTVDGFQGVLFAVWAPNAERVSVVGSFNQWDGRKHTMRVRAHYGVWELFVPGCRPGSTYKFEIRSRDTGHVFLKVDPYARRFEKRPNTASIVEPVSAFEWTDAEWLSRREGTDWGGAPMSTYELHLGSWRRNDREPNGFASYRELAGDLISHVKQLGFTHIELLPLTEHPLDASWGYQTVGYFAPTSRYGTPDELRYLIDTCHRNGVGVLMDWAPAHFPKDAHALARYDGTPLYEHRDPVNAELRDWGTLMFDFGRHEVRSFLISSALYWLEAFHIDGLRVDAVAAMLYLDYSKRDGEWTPNRYGGNENLDAVQLLRQLNETIQREQPGALMIAEESTSWPQVTGPSWLGGLDFSMKWNLGWMNDTLAYFRHDPVYRSYHHENLTFGIIYSFSERFLLPLSHDEVVHLKGSLLAKMPGDEWQQFANLRLLYTYMWTYPGKKLLFMGGEFAQSGEWNHERGLEWPSIEGTPNGGVQRLVGDLNHLYASEPALHQFDFEPQGFRWIDCHDAAQSIVSYERFGASGTVVVVLNFTPVVRHNYRIGVPPAQRYVEVLNSDAEIYGGSNVGNQGGVGVDDTPWMSRPCSVSITVPPLAGLILKADSR